MLPCVSSVIDHRWRQNVVKKRSGTQASEFFKNSRLFYYTFKIFLQQRVQKFGRFLFVHILLHRFNPIRSQLETVLHLWLVYVCVKECELMWGHIFGLLAVTTLPHRKLSSKFWPIFRPILVHSWINSWAAPWKLPGNEVDRWSISHAIIDEPHF